MLSIQTIHTLIWFVNKIVRFFHMILLVYFKDRYIQ